MTIDPDRDALLVVDVQHDFLPGGALAVPDGDAVIEPIARIAPRFRCVVATQDFHPRGHVSFASAHGRRPYESIDLDSGRGRQELWPDHCVAGSHGALLHADVPREAVTLILRKGTRPDVDSYSAFNENFGPGGRRLTTGLGAWLRARGSKRVFIAGLARDFCVKWSAQDAVAEGFDTWVVDDASRPVFPQASAQVDAELARAGVGRIASAELLHG